MRRIVLGLVLSLCCAVTLSAAPTELFFSEYVEGSSFNKVLEIYNGTDAAVNLGTLGYSIEMYFNGNLAAGLTINLTGSVAAGGTYVVTNNSAAQSIKNIAQLVTLSTSWFNGDDAVVLKKAGVIVDSIGQVGFDPGTEWGSGLVSTADNTIRRKTTVCAGDPSAADAFNPSVEWDGFANDTFGGLGSHTVNCGTTTLTVSIADRSLNEGDSGTSNANFTVSLTGGNAPAGGLSFTVSTADGSATAGSDYIAVSNGNFTIPANTNSITVSVAVYGDAVFENDETFLINITSATGATIGDGQAVGTILNDDAAPVDHVVISQIYGGGGNSGATFTHDYIELFNPTDTSINLNGWSAQYASAAGFSWQVQPLAGEIGPDEYYLISLATNGNVGNDLPPANIPSAINSINMSATTGKIALVRNGDALSGTCPFGTDTDIVDFLGYGTTANCREGSANAPAPSNTTALFRKTAGSTDTNQNGSDFVTALPTPRRTAPIVEIGPFVLTTDPRSSGTNAPRDASITVSFTEPVDVTGDWFSINCPSGAHNDATVASVAGGNSYVITPNVNFAPGEMCTVLIFKDFVTDQDLDDGPTTDTLPANHSWTFTVATGTAPPNPVFIHLLMGNPSGAVADTGVPTNYLMEKPEFALSYNRDRGTPNWVSWHLSDEWVGTLQRVDTFRPDPAVPPDWYRVLGTDYFSSGFDRGHMVPNADRDKETSIPINQATFLMTNMLPQAPDNNQGPWANLENYLRTLLPANELYIVAGGAGTAGTITNGHVTVPAHTWKVALVLPKDLSDDDVPRVTAARRTIAVVMPNIQGIRTNNNDDWMNYLTTVDAVEAVTGYDFFANVSDAIENSIEAGINGVNPPGVTNQIVTTDEDEAKAFTLEAVSPDDNPLSYIIVNAPAHGTLSGSGASRTYTPAPDFHGTDTVTFKVNNNGTDSNVGTVTINVRSVNDAPVMSALSLSTTELWPANHKMVDVVVMYSMSDDGQAACSLGVTSNEPENGTGDGDTAPDWEIVDANVVRLRAERDGGGEGRQYTIRATCTDDAGASTEKTAVVTVPKSQGKK